MSNETGVKADVTCNHCALCCILPNGKDCRYLIRLKTTTLCRIYRNRIGAKIYPGMACMDIMYAPNQPGCPYNELKDEMKREKNETKTMVLQEDRRKDNKQKEVNPEDTSAPGEDRAVNQG